MTRPNAHEPKGVLQYVTVDPFRFRAYLKFFRTEVEQMLFQSDDSVTSDSTQQNEIIRYEAASEEIIYGNGREMKDQPWSKLLQSSKRKSLSR